MKKVTIKALLEWAFNEELCKAQTEGGSGAYAGSGFWSGFAELGTLVDAPVNGFGVVPDFSATGEPHPDAVAVAEAVKRLPAGWQMPERPDLADVWAARLTPESASPLWLPGREAAIREVVDALRERPVNQQALVIRCAVRKRAPEWSAEPPQTRARQIAGRDAWWMREDVADGMGGVSVVWSDGWDAKAHKPKVGAVQRIEATPETRMEMAERLDWLVWVAGLGHVHSLLTCSQALNDHVLEPFRMPSRMPWDVQAMAQTG